MSYRLDRKLAVAFIGMFPFMSTVGMAMERANHSGALLAPIALGSILLVLVFPGGPHNPPVSTAVFLRAKLADLLGGSAAAGALLYIQGEHAKDD